MAMVEATEDVAEAIMGDSAMATAMAFTRDMDTVAGVILIGGITLTIPVIMCWSPGHRGYDPYTGERAWIPGRWVPCY